MGQVYPQNFFSKDNRKIVLTEKVYLRLLSLINLSQYKTGIDIKKLEKGYEYGGFILGCIDKNGDIIFDEVNKSSNFTLEDGAFNLQSDMNAIDELIEKLTTKEINCAAHIHTHPYHINGTESGRFFSAPDIEYYKLNFSSEAFSKLLNKEVLMLGCLLTASNDFNDKSKGDDDISFVYYDAKTKEMKYIPYIYIKTKDGLLKLNHITDYIAVNKSTGKIYNSNDVATENAIDYDVYEVKRNILK